MDSIVERTSVTANTGPTREQAEEAVRLLIRWAGDDPRREGLMDTPRRVVDAYKELFCGYSGPSDDLMARTFSDVGGYQDLVIIKDVAFFSHCEHHMLPFYGKVHIGYLPSGAFGRRLQTQETMTAQIAEFLAAGLRPTGLAVMVEAEHMCMSMRGVQKRGAITQTATFKGTMSRCPRMQARFMSALRT